MTMASQFQFFTISRQMGFYIMNRRPKFFHILEYQLILVSKETPSEVLGRNLQRILDERGLDFFERIKDGSIESGILPSANEADKQEDESKDGASDDEGEGSGQTMTKDELYKLKMEVMPQL